MLETQAPSEKLRPRTEHDRLYVRMLGLRSLQERRLRQDLICTYKIIFGFVDLDYFRLFFVSPDETPRGHGGNLFA